jgi:hypothetical protein
MPKARTTQTPPAADAAPADPAPLVEAYLAVAAPSPKSFAAFDPAKAAAILAADKPTQIAVVRRLVAALTPGRHGTVQRPAPPDKTPAHHAAAMRALLTALCSRRLPYTFDDLRQITADLVGHLEAHRPNLFQELFERPFPGLLPSILDRTARLYEGAEVPGALRDLLARLADCLEDLRFNSAYASSLRKLKPLVGQSDAGLMDAGEEWADAARTAILAAPSKARAGWQALISSAPTGNAASPPAKWIKGAAKHLDAIGRDEFVRRVGEWSALIGRRETSRVSDRNAVLLKALLWAASLCEGPEIATALSTSAEACFSRAGQMALRCSKAGKAALYSLAQLPGLDGLARLQQLKLRVKSPWALEEITRTVDEAARARNISPDELDELAVPDHGLDPTGHLRVDLAPFAADLSVTPAGRVALTFTSSDGKSTESPPAKLKSAHNQAIKDLKRVAGDISATLTTQRDRLDRLYLARRTWPLALWRQRYLGHPLLGHLARRLIWTIDGTPALFVDGAPIDVRGQPVPSTTASRVALWHPIDSPTEHVLAWRDRLEARRITQPFKQAHREIYLLTDPERRTGTYSNRFAAHVLRQHQLHALCQARGWRHDYHGQWDSSDAHARLPLHAWDDLTAHFWTHPAGDGQASPAGVLLHVSSDQVRFTDRAGAPLPLDRVPPLVFSEVMRDVDLFVGVASIAADPAWQDGGDDDRFRAYWQQASFGELSAPAQTRRAVLEKLLPRLKIADRCSIADHFLVVRGNLRAYRIHLGSGNILMEPDRQYLCIVPDHSAKAARGDLFLPFEGDPTLSLILSKAFLLSADDKITDPTITRQLAPHRANRPSS